MTISLAAACKHPLSSRLTLTDLCMECMPADSVPGIPRPVGEQLVEGIAAILETPREPEDQARQIAQWLVWEFEIARRAP